MASLLFPAALLVAGCGGSVSGSGTPPPPTAPTVTSVTPASAATGVAIMPAITATFSHAMTASTISASTFTVSASGGAAVSGTVTYATAGPVATFTPGANLAYSTQYTATITTGAQDSTGTALAANYVWTFTTAAAPPVPPTVTVTVPANGATTVSDTHVLTASFSVAMNPATLTPSTFTVSSAGGPVSGAVTYSADNSMAVFTPSAALSYNTAYTATITTGATAADTAALAADYVWTFTTAAAPTNLATVDFGSLNQTIRGFGGSTAWMGQLSTSTANALFGNGANQLGLSILRVRIDPSGSAPGWETSNWTQELGNATEAIAANPNAIVFATPWTPPPSMKTSSASQPYNPSCGYTPISYCGGYLNSTSYADYAAYLEDFVTYFKNNGVNLYGISMQNEPDENVSYESCVWTGQTMDAWVASLTAGGATDPLATKLIMPESAVFDTSYSDPALNDSSAVGNISIVGGHLYMNGTSLGTPFYYTNAENNKKDVWMTEHYLTPSGAQPVIADALLAAKEINDSLTIGQYNAYVWWWIADFNSGGGVINYGLLDPTNIPNYYGYAMAQYSHFIQPGYVRATATANPSTNVYLSAYTGGGHFVIVAINLGATSVSQPFQLQNGTVTSLTPYQTTAASGIAQQTAVPVTDQQFTYTLPAQSIVTFVQ